MRLGRLLLLLDVGREAGSSLPSLLLLPTGSSLGILYELGSPPRPLRALAVEFCRLRLAPGWALHRLLTLSERFIIALCTKPPMPLVGDAGRSLPAPIRAWDEDMVKVRPRPDWSPSVTEALSETDAACLGISALCLLCSEIDVVVENLLLQAPLPLVEPAFDSPSEVTLSAAGLVSRGSSEVSRDMPGSPLLPANTLSPPSCSSLLFLNAALPIPRSAVCLNQPGSLAPSDAAI